MRPVSIRSGFGTLVLLACSVMGTIGPAGCSKPTPPADEGGSKKAGSTPASPVVINITQVNASSTGSQPAPAVTAVSPAPAPQETVPVVPTFNKPELLINAFCECWIRQDFTGMYAMLDPETRAGLGFAAFSHRFAADAEFNGGLKSGTILGRVEDLGNRAAYRVQLGFRNTRSPERVVVARITQTPNGWLVMESGLIPPDLSQQ